MCSKVPLPDTFFSIKHQLRPIAPLRLSAPSAVVVYLLTLGGFVGCWIFYSLPNPPVTTTVIQSEWQKEGYECKPLQKDSDYGLTYTYDECLQNIKSVSVDTVIEKGSPDCGPCSGWAYVPFGSDKKSLVISPQNCDVAKEMESWFQCHLMVQFLSLTGSSKAKAIDFYTRLVAKFPVCNIFKQNAPFQCTKTEITYKSSLEILSLSIANTQLLFGVLTAFCAYIFYKLKKKDSVLPVGGAGLQEAVEQLKKQVGGLQQALTKKADKTDKETV
jgi:hypothetical protein